MELNITKFIKKETNLKDGNKSQKFTERELNVLIYKALKEQLILSGVVKSLPSKEEILLQARKIENYIGEEMPIVGAEKSGKFHGFLEGVEWLISRQK